MTADGLPPESHAESLIGVVLVDEGFDAHTPIGGLPPLLRHALALQAAGANSVVVLPLWAADQTRDADQSTLPELPSSERLTIPVVRELPAHRRALVVRADVTTHRALPPRLASRLISKDEIVIACDTQAGDIQAGDTKAALYLCGSERTAAVIAALESLVTPAGAVPEPLLGEGPFAEFIAPAGSPDERKRATKLHLRSLRKPTGGVLENLYMRPLSMHMTAALCNTRITPNAMSIVTLGVALAAALLVALPDPRYSVAGGLLHIFMRVVDCIDGELARLRYQSSRFGEWPDTVGDGIGMAALIAGVTVHVSRHDPSLFMLGMTGVAAWLLVQALQIAGAVSQAETGTFHRVQWGHRTTERSPIERFVAAVEMAFRIDAISTYYGLLLVFGAHELLLRAHTTVAVIASAYFATQVWKLRARRTTDA